MNSIHDGTVLVLSEYRLEYYGGLLLLLLLLHISIKLFFSSVFLLSLSRYLLLFCAPLQLLLCMVLGWRRKGKTLMCYTQAIPREKRREFFFSFHSFEYLYTHFLSAHFTTFIFSELGWNWVLCLSWSARFHTALNLLGQKNVSKIHDV